MKVNLRKQLKLLKDINLQTYKNAAFPTLQQNFIKWFNKRNFRVIAFFHPLKHEINLLPIACFLDEQGYKIALPRIIAEQKLLTFKEWVITDSLETNHFGVKEPLESAIDIAPDLIITPLLGFDRRGARLGYGGGYYDKTLVNYPKSIKVALCYSFQEVKNIPKEPHDVPLDWVITEKEIIKINENIGNIKRS